MPSLGMKDEDMGIISKFVGYLPDSCWYVLNDNG